MRSRLLRWVCVRLTINNKISIWTKIYHYDIFRGIKISLSCFCHVGHVLEALRFVWMSWGNLCSENDLSPLRCQALNWIITYHLPIHLLHNTIMPQYISHNATLCDRCGHSCAHFFNLRFVHCTSSINFSNHIVLNVDMWTGSCITWKVLKLRSDFKNMTLHRVPSRLYEMLHGDYFLVYSDMRLP